MGARMSTQTKDLFDKCGAGTLKKLQKQQQQKRSRKFSSSNDKIVSVNSGTCCNCNNKDDGEAAGDLDEGFAEMLLSASHQANDTSRNLKNRLYCFKLIFGLYHTKPETLVKIFNNADFEPCIDFIPLMNRKNGIVLDLNSEHSASHLIHCMVVAIIVYLNSHQGTYKNTVFNTENNGMGSELIDEDIHPDNITNFITFLISKYQNNQHIIVPAAILLIEKLLVTSGIIFDSKSWKKIVLVCVVDAAKQVSDYAIQNNKLKLHTKQCGHDSTALYELELELMKLLNCELMVSQEVLLQAFEDLGQICLMFKINQNSSGLYFTSVSQGEAKPFTCAQ